MAKAHDKDKLTLEKCRQEMAKKYKSEISELNIEIKRLRDENSELRDKISNYESEMLTMKDWLERMQEYTNMDQKDLEDLIASEKAKGEIDKAMSRLINGPFGLLFGKMHY